MTVSLELDAGKGGGGIDSIELLRAGFQLSCLPGAESGRQLGTKKKAG
jgi:hypothetical protein